MSDTIRLDPVLFDALHLSALANGGIGWGKWYVDSDRPCCPVGHLFALGVIPSLSTDTSRLGIDEDANDWPLRDAGIPEGELISFQRWRRLLGVDVAA